MAPAGFIFATRAQMGSGLIPFVFAGPCALLSLKCLAVAPVVSFSVPAGE